VALIVIRTPFGFDYLRRAHLLLSGYRCFPRDHDHGVNREVHRHGFRVEFRVAQYGSEYAFAARGQYPCGSVQIVHPAWQGFVERWSYCGKNRRNVKSISEKQTYKYVTTVLCVPIEGLAMTTGSWG